jgi:adenine-specific DNA-methyltransferase
MGHEGRDDSLSVSQACEKTGHWGLDNPHPFSQMKTELIWEGKYDVYGNRRTVDIAGCAMPLQEIETIGEPASRAVARIF